MLRTALTASAALVAVGLSVQPASASYMANCNKLIGAWKACTASSASCGAQRSAIETQCKCHSYQGGEWKLAMAAVAKNDVCGEGDPGDTPPIITPPRNPPHPPIIEDPNRGGRGGVGEQRDPNGGRGT